MPRVQPSRLPRVLIVSWRTAPGSRCRRAGERQRRHRGVGLRRCCARVDPGTEAARPASGRTHPGRRACRARVGGGMRGRSSGVGSGPPRRYQETRVRPRKGLGAGALVAPGYPFHPGVATRRRSDRPGRAERGTAPVESCGRLRGRSCAYASSHRRRRYDYGRDPGRSRPGPASGRGSSRGRPSRLPGGVTRSI